MTFNEQLQAAWAEAAKRNKATRNPNQQVTVMIQNQVLRGNKIIYSELHGEGGIRFFAFPRKADQRMIKSLRLRGWTAAPKPVAASADVEPAGEAKKPGRPKKDASDEV
jgi:hypothetical protein